MRTAYFTLAAFLFAVSAINGSVPLLMLAGGNLLAGLLWDRPDVDEDLEGDRT
jgi:hypothetical protein